MTTSTPLPPQPTPSPTGPLLPPPARRRPTRKVLAAAGGVIVLIGAFAVHAAAGPSGASGYRTATVATSDVDQTLEGVGTVEPVTQTAVAFPVAGTVATVDVAVGDTVTVGQTLATLDPASLQTTIDTKQAAVDQAALVLEKARNGESSGGGGPTGASTDATSSSTATTTATTTASTTASRSAEDPNAASDGSSGGATSSVDDTVRAAQQAVLDGQREVDGRLQASQQALDSAGRICAAAGTDTSSPTTTSTTEPTTSTSTSTTSTIEPTTSTTEPTTSTTEPTTSTTASDDETAASARGGGETTPDTSTDNTSTIEACRTALQDVLDAQQLVSDAQTSLSEAATSYDELLDQRAEELATTSQATTTASSSPAGSDTGSSTGTGASAASTVSSADLIKYQKAVDAAEAELTVAQQALKQATVVSPIAGTVASVGLAAGDSVTAGSTTATIVVVGEGGVEVTTTVAVDHLPAIDLGQSATVRPDGGGDAITGEVVAIGAPTTSSTGATTYPVTIALPDSTDGLRNGSVASVTIVTKKASDALVVPTSAVSTEGTAHTVTVVDGGSTKSVSVEIGAIGSTWTEVKSGLEEGQEVVLATLDKALPTSATQVSSNNGQGQGQGQGRVFTGGGGGGGFSGPPSG